MAASLVIRNGRMLDPARGIDAVGDLHIRAGRILAPGDPTTASHPVEVIDAQGCLVIPGLIDFHTHIAHRLTDTGVHPDLMALPNGITAAVDAGSVGCASASAFIADIVCRSEITVRAFLNVSALGVATELHTECPDPERYDADAIAEVFAAHPGSFIGLKIRLGKGFSDGLGLDSFRRAKAIARQVNKPLCVHAVNPEFHMEDLLAELEAGDVLCHCFLEAILGKDGTISDAAWRARKRGVVFDVAAGRVNHDLAVIKQAYVDGFRPDIISTDVVKASLYDRKLFHLLRVMSTFLAVGVPLSEVVRCCTTAPASYMGLEGAIGSLAPGARADVAILRIREKPVEFADQYGHSVRGNEVLVPQVTVLGGKVVYKQIEFDF